MKVENSGSVVLSQLEHVETSCNAAFKIPMRLLTWTTTHLQFTYTFIIARQMEIKPNIQYIQLQLNLSSWKVWKIAQSGSVPFQRRFEGSTGPTPAPHLLWLPSLEHHPYAISLYLSTRGPPCRLPGLCSFPADGIVTQVDVCHGFVDLQRLGDCLWPERWQARRLSMQSTKTFVTPVELSCHAGYQQESQVQ